MPSLIRQNVARDFRVEYEDRMLPTSGSMAQRFARDPYAQLDATEVWVDPHGVERRGHIFIPDLLTLQETPLHPFDHQRDFTANWIDLELLAATGRLEFSKVHVEKSRQMGMTWWLAYLVWWLLTYHEAPGGYLNMDSDEVDDGGSASSPDSFFGKIRYIDDRVPTWAGAPLAFRGGNSPSVRNQAKTGAYVVGEGKTPNPARGGAFLWWLWDEAARFPFGEAAMTSLSIGVKGGLVLNSTPHGESNVYFRIRDEQPADYRFVRYHWSRHPVYGRGRHRAGTLPSCQTCIATRDGIPWSAENPISHRYPGKLTSPWYEAAILGLTDDQVASELDIDYAGSLAARVYVEFDPAIHVLDRIPYDPKLALSFAFDYGLDVTAIAVLQESASELRQIGELEVSDATPDMICPLLVEYLAYLGHPRELLTRSWTRQMFAVGDASGEGRELATGRPLVAEYRRNGFSIISRHWKTIAPTITATKRMLLGKPLPYRISRERCPKTIRHWQLNRWPVDREGSRKPGAPHPVDDEHNHMLRALAYYITYRFPPQSEDDDVGSVIERVRGKEMFEGRLTEATYDMIF